MIDLTERNVSIANLLPKFFESVMLTNLVFSNDSLLNYNNNYLVASSCSFNAYTKFISLLRKLILSSFYKYYELGKKPNIGVTHSVLLNANSMSNF